MRNNWDILSHSSKTRGIHSSRLMTALRKPPNLRSFLVRARSDYHGKDHQKHDAAIRGCTYNVCTTAHCTRIDTSGQITSSVTQRQYTSKYNVSCQSSNIVYCITVPANDPKNSTSARLNAGSWTDSRITSIKFPRP